MQLACPSCATRDVRVSQSHGLGEYLKSLVGVSQLRCRRCNHRWQTSIWANSSWRFARCPRCYRQELTRWAVHRYNSPRWTRFLLRLGATAHRCEVCRCNFASFKPRRENFSWSHQIRVEAGSSAAEAADPQPALLTGQTPPVEGSGEQMP